MFRTAYSHLTEPRFSVNLDFTGQVSMTEQNHRTECDINVLLGRYKRTGQLPANTRIGQFMDVSAMDFQTAMEIAALGRQAFEELPSTVRNKFGNDPRAFLEFVHDERNAPALVEMGLAVAPLARPEAPSEAVSPVGAGEAVKPA